MSEEIQRVDLPEPRYEFGGDDHVFVELDQEMSFEANFLAMAITQQIRTHDVDGITEICPANASYLVRFDPDVAAPTEVVAELRAITDETEIAEYSWRARVIDFPVLYRDPWTLETQMQFRDRHQDPDATDLEYCARINDFDSVDDFVAAHAGAPHMVTMIGFVPGLAWCHQMVPRDEQIEAPKYEQPRTDTPARAMGFGGAFTTPYPVQGAGGYQLFGRTPLEVLDVNQRLPDFEESMVLPNPGDIFNFRRIDREEYDDIREQVEADDYEYTIEEVEFSPEEFFEAPHEYNAELTEVLY
jgi:urea carboxylase